MKIPDMDANEQRVVNDLALCKELGVLPQSVKQFPFNVTLQFKLFLGFQEVQVFHSNGGVEHFALFEYSLATLRGALQVISLIYLHVSVEHVIHDRKVNLLVCPCRVLAVEYDLMEAVYLRDDRFLVFHRQILVVGAKDLLNELEFSSTDGLKYELSITRVVEEGTTFATGDKLGQGLEIRIEHVTQDVVWPQTLRVEVFSYPEGLPNAGKDLWCVVIEGASLNVVFCTRPVRGELILAANGELLFADLNQWDIQCRVNCLFYAHHNVADKVKVFMSRVNQLSSLQHLRPGFEDLIFLNVCLRHVL